jgi:hypothetical protein
MQTWLWLELHFANRQLCKENAIANKYITTQS